MYAGNFNKSPAGLPDGLFSNQKYQFGLILEGLRMENVDIYIGIFYGHLGYFMTIWYIYCSFSTFYSGFGIMYPEKSGNPGLKKENYVGSNSNSIFKFLKSIGSV
jgi:hypothetical protein